MEFCLLILNDYFHGKNQISKINGQWEIADLLNFPISTITYF